MLFPFHHHCQPASEAPFLNQNRHLWSDTMGVIVSLWKDSMCFANAALAAANLRDNFCFQPLIKERCSAWMTSYKMPEGCGKGPASKCCLHLGPAPASVNRQLRFWVQLGPAGVWVATGDVNLVEQMYPRWTDFTRYKKKRRYSLFFFLKKIYKHVSNAFSCLIYNLYLTDKDYTLCFIDSCKIMTSQKPFLFKQIFGIYPQTPNVETCCHHTHISVWTSVILSGLLRKKR